MTKEEIEKLLRMNDRETEITEQLYLINRNLILDTNGEIELKIKKNISNFLKIELRDIFIVGSSQTGFSLIKNKDFVQGESDLDISIINSSLFIKYLEISNVTTKGFNDMSKFSIRKGQSTEAEFLKNISRGIFRPDLMPNCNDKNILKNYFEKLSSEYIYLFDKINAGIYLSEKSFIQKQEQTVKQWRRINAKL